MSTKRKAAVDARAAITEHAAQSKRAKPSATTETPTAQDAAATGVTQANVGKELAKSSPDKVAAADAAGLQQVDDKVQSKNASVERSLKPVKAVRGGSSSNANRSGNNLPSDSAKISASAENSSQTQRDAASASTSAGSKAKKRQKDEAETVPSAKSAPVKKRSRKKKPQIEKGTTKSALRASKKVAQSRSSGEEEVQAVPKTLAKGELASRKAKINSESADEDTKHASSKAKKRGMAVKEDKHAAKADGKEGTHAVTVIWSARPHRREVYTSVSFRGSSDTDAGTYRSTKLQAFCFKQTRKMEPPEHVDWDSPLSTAAAEAVFRPVRKTVKLVDRQTFLVITQPQEAEEVAKEEALYARKLASYRRRIMEGNSIDDSKSIDQVVLYGQQTQNDAAKSPRPWTELDGMRKI
ncbi:hypothetical protein AC579_262 [Pseudocercospora musae]|uniref:CUT domain-containing protein n=1 Tax=Pseudocercospora musae TaxID=113226 RepID=A0A139I3K3_9PEZI|nr:hypothetical protein AC579_262 [Pseudocercospora musae]